MHYHRVSCVVRTMLKHSKVHKDTDIPGNHTATGSPISSKHSLSTPRLVTFCQKGLARTDLWFFFDELLHQINALFIIYNDHLHTAIPQVLFVNLEIDILANDDSRDLVREDSACTHTAWTARVGKSNKRLTTSGFRQSRTSMWYTIQTTKSTVSGPLISWQDCELDRRTSPVLAPTP